MTRRKLFGIIPIPFLPTIKPAKEWRVSIEDDDGVKYTQTDALARYKHLVSDTFMQKLTIRLYQGDRLKQIARTK